MSGERDKGREHTCICRRRGELVPECRGRCVPQKLQCVELGGARYRSGCFQKEKEGPWTPLVASLETPFFSPPG